MSFNPGSALTPSHDDPLEDSVLIRLTETRAAATLGVSASAIVKSIVLEHRQEPRGACLAIVPGDCRVSRAKVATALAVGRLRLAPAEVVKEATGYRPGGVPPIGHRQPLQVVIDRRVFDHDVVYGGGGDEWHMLRLEPRVIPYGAKKRPRLGRCWSSLPSSLRLCRLRCSSSSSRSLAG